MLIPSFYSQKGLFERLVRGKNGALIRVRFEVVEFNGELRGRVISAEPVIELQGQKSKVKSQNGSLCLPCASSEILHLTSYIFAFAPTVSPYNTLEFFMSQPTRAPSL